MANNGEYLYFQKHALDLLAILCQKANRGAMEYLSTLDPISMDSIGVVAHLRDTCPDADAFFFNLGAAAYLEIVIALVTYVHTIVSWSKRSTPEATVLQHLIEELEADALPDGTGNPKYTPDWMDATRYYLQAIRSYQKAAQKP